VCADTASPSFGSVEVVPEQHAKHKRTTTTTTQHTERMNTAKTLVSLPMLNLATATREDVLAYFRNGTHKSGSPFTIHLHHLSFSLHVHPRLCRHQSFFDFGNKILEIAILWPKTTRTDGRALRRWANTYVLDCVDWGWCCD
jgi:hypothetical protein